MFFQFNKFDLRDVYRCWPLLVVGPRSYWTTSFSSSYTRHTTESHVLSHVKGDSLHNQCNSKIDSRSLSESEKIWTRHVIMTAFQSKKTLDTVVEKRFLK